MSVIFNQMNLKERVPIIASSTHRPPGHNRKWYKCWYHEKV